MWQRKKDWSGLEKDWVLILIMTWNMCCCFYEAFSFLKIIIYIMHSVILYAYPVLVMCPPPLLPLWAFIGLYAIYRTLLLLPTADSKAICSSGSSLVFEVFLVRSGTQGSIRSPLSRRYGGRSAIFSHSEADRGFSAWNYSLEVNSKWKHVVFKMGQCLPETFFVCSSKVNFSSSISKNIRSFELY